MFWQKIKNLFKKSNKNNMPQNNPTDEEKMKQLEAAWKEFQDKMAELQKQQMEIISDFKSKKDKDEIEKIKQEEL